MTSDLKTITVDLGQSFGTDVPHFHPDPAIPNDPLMSMVAQAYTQNRMAPHLHGGDTVWISDGDMYQWITPEGEQTAYPQGVSVHNVPDMPDPGDGSMTFFYSNHQSARLMFVHDHAAGITRLNVYAGEAMGYLLTDQVEQDLINQGVLPDLGTPLIIQDKTFIDPKTVLTTDPTWPLPVDQSGSTSNLWTPHVYIPNQNPNGPDGTNPTGRWDYGPFFWPPWPTTEAPIQGVGNIQVQDGGSNYTKPPIVTFVPYAGDTTGSGATATAVISGGVLTDIQVATASGSGYSAPPVVTITNAPRRHHQSLGRAGRSSTPMARSSASRSSIRAPDTPSRPDRDHHAGTSRPSRFDGHGHGHHQRRCRHRDHDREFRLRICITTDRGDHTGARGHNGQRCHGLGRGLALPERPQRLDDDGVVPGHSGGQRHRVSLHGRAARGLPVPVLDASDDRMWNLQLYTSSSILSTITITNPGSGYTRGADDHHHAGPGRHHGDGGHGDGRDRRSDRLDHRHQHRDRGQRLHPAAHRDDLSARARRHASHGRGHHLHRPERGGHGPGYPGRRQLPPVVDGPDRSASRAISSMAATAASPTREPSARTSSRSATRAASCPRPWTSRARRSAMSGTRRISSSAASRSTSLLLGPAERADIIIDFSQFAGKTVILYNDSPAPVPATDSRLDYFTDDLNQTSTGGTVSTHAGYGPNTRTIMVFHVAATTPHPYDVQKLMDAFTTTSTHQGVFEQDQNPIIVPQAGYDAAYNANFSSGTDAYARIQSTSLTFRPLDLSQPTKVSPTSVTIDFQPKTIQELFDNDYRAYGSLPRRRAALHQRRQPDDHPLHLQRPGHRDHRRHAEHPDDQIGSLGDGTQIWKITHNGVDTHPVHFHLFDVQVIDRVGWDGMVKPPDPNELGWKDTVRMNPLEDIIVALRPTAPAIPFGVPDSIRLLNPDMPLGTTWSTFDPTTGNPITVTNAIYNFGWEYMWHCHILSHEEMSMMRPIQFNVPVLPPDQATAWETRKRERRWTSSGSTRRPPTIRPPRGTRRTRSAGKSSAPSRPAQRRSRRWRTCPPTPRATSTTTANPNTAYVYEVTAYNAYTTQNPNSLNPTTVDAPVASVSTTVTGEHGTGESIPITITFDKPVNVTGLPELALNSTGTGSTAKAIYSGGTGTATLTFLYQVTRGQTAAPPDYTSTNALTLPNDATIVYADSSGAAPLALPTPGTKSDGLFAQDITIDPKMVPVVYWPTPANIVYGAALGAGQLNATVTFNSVPVPGSKDYKVDPGMGVKPAMGVVLYPGTYPLTMHFTPTDTTNYMAVDATQSITVLMATPTFVVSEPPSIVYGSPWLNITGQLKAPYPVVMPGGDTVSIIVNAVTYTATTTSGGNFTLRLDTSELPVSSTPYVIAYTYAGDSDYQAASDSSTSLQVTAAATTTSLSASASSSMYGQSVMFTAQVIPASGSGIPTGNVVFMDGATVLGSSPMSDSIASFSTSSLAVASHNIMAVYQGSSNFAPSHSFTYSQIVNPAFTTTTLDVERTSNRRRYELDVIVTPAYPGAVVPGGSVVFNVGGRKFGTVQLVNGAAQLYVGSQTVMRKWVNAAFKSNTVSFGSSVSNSIHVTRATRGGATMTRTPASASTAKIVRASTHPVVRYSPKPLARKPLHR